MEERGWEERNSSLLPAPHKLALLACPNATQCSHNTGVGGSETGSLWPEDTQGSRMQKQWELDSIYTPSFDPGSSPGSEALGAQAFGGGGPPTKVGREEGRGEAGQALPTLLLLLPAPYPHA